MGVLFNNVRTSSIQKMDQNVSISKWIKMLKFIFSFYKIISKFTEFINYCRALEYDETPDYEHLRNMLKNRMKLKNYEFDKNFDWIENDPFQQVQS